MYLIRLYKHTVYTHNPQSQVSQLVRPCGKPSPSITAQHELVFALQAPLLPGTFISHWHSKGPHLCRCFDPDHSCVPSFLPSCRFSLPFTFTKISFLYFIIFTFFTHFICSPSLHAVFPLISHCPNPFWVLLFYLFPVLSLSPGLMSFPLHWLSSSLSFFHLCVSHFFSYASVTFFFAKLHTLFYLPAYV